MTGVPAEVFDIYGEKKPVKPALDSCRNMRSGRKRQLESCFDRGELLVVVDGREFPQVTVTPKKL